MLASFETCTQNPGQNGANAVGLMFKRQTNSIFIPLEQCFCCGKNPIKEWKGGNDSIREQTGRNRMLHWVHSHARSQIQQTQPHCVHEISLLFEEAAATSSRISACWTQKTLFATWLVSCRSSETDLLAKLTPLNPSWTVEEKCE